MRPHSGRCVSCVVCSCGVCVPVQWWFSPPYWFHGQYDPPYFNATNCEFNGTFQYGMDFTRPLDSSLKLGPFDDETNGGTHVINVEMLEQMTGCGANYVSMAELNPNKMKGFVWSWDVNQPASTAPPNNCATLNSGHDSRLAFSRCM